MGLFNLGKPKPMSEKKKAKIIDKIKKNKLEINKLEAEAQMMPLSKGKTKKYIKLKEANVKMAKELIIKNGRLEKVDKTEQQGAPAPQQTQAPPQAPPRQEMPQAPLPPGFPEQPTQQGGNTMVGEPALNAQMRQAPPQAPPQQPQQPDPYLEALKAQEAQQRAQAQHNMQQRAQAMAQARAQAEAARAQQAQQYAPQQERNDPGAVIPVTIYLVENKKLTTQIPEEELIIFVKELQEAINNQQTFQLGDRFINGFHVIFYEIGN